MDDYTLEHTITSENTMLVSECEDYGVHNRVMTRGKQAYHDRREDHHNGEDDTVDNDGFSMVESMIGKYEEATDKIAFEDFKMHLVELNSQWEEILGQTLLESETLLYRQRKELQQTFDEERQELETKAKEEIDNAWEIVAANEEKLAEVQDRVKTDMVTIKTEMESRIKAMHDQMAAEKEEAVKNAIEKEREAFEDEKKILFQGLNENSAKTSQNIQNSMKMAKKQAEDEFQKKLKGTQDELQSSITKLKAKHRLEIQRLRKNNQEKEVKVSDLKKELQLEKEKAVEEAIKQTKETIQNEADRQIELLKKGEAKSLETLTQRYERRLRNLQSEHGVEIQRLREEFAMHKEEMEKDYADTLEEHVHEKEALMTDVANLSDELNMIKESESERMEELKSQLSEHITKLISRHDDEIQELKQQHETEITQKETHHKSQVKKIKELRELAVSNSEGQMKLAKQKFDRQINELKKSHEKIIHEKDEQINILKNQEQPKSTMGRDDFEKHLQDIQNSYEKKIEVEKAIHANEVSKLKELSLSEKERAIEDAVNKTIEDEKRKYQEQTSQNDLKSNDKCISPSTERDIDTMIQINEQSGKLIDFLTNEVERLKTENDRLKQTQNMIDTSKPSTSTEEHEMNNAISKIIECDVDIKFSPAPLVSGSPKKKIGSSFSYKEDAYESYSFKEDVMNMEKEKRITMSPVSPDRPFSSVSWEEKRKDLHINQIDGASPICTEATPTNSGSSNFIDTVEHNDLDFQKLSLDSFEKQTQNKDRLPVSSPQSEKVTPRSNEKENVNDYSFSSEVKKMGSGSKQSSKIHHKRIIGAYTLSSSVPPDPNEVKLLILNVSLTQTLKKMAVALNVTLEDDVLQATHVIAGDSYHPIRRTPKLMAALCRTTNILSLDWLKDSYKQKSLVGCSHYLLIHDSIAEATYNFSMKATLREGSERQSEGGLLNGWYIYFSNNVAGKRAPKKEDLNMMINAAGGTVIDRSDLPLDIGKDRSRVIVITSDPPLPEQTGNRLGKELANEGAGFFSTTWLFQCMMQQKLTGIRRGFRKA